MRNSSHCGRRQILIVDDDAALREALRYCLGRSGFGVTEAESEEEMQAALARTPADVVLLDVFLRDGDSLRHLSRLRAEHPSVPVIMITGSGTIDMAVEATRRGVYDFITKPVDTKRLLTSIRSAIQMAHKEEGPSPTGRPAPAAAMQEILGETAPIHRLKERIAQVAASDCTVLIAGETGSGKELVAQAIHRGGPRAKQEMPVVNCGALPGELVESELFGHEQGAFTGATRKRIGLAERAHRSTLFLDEISEMPIALQTKLLRFLENRSFHRVGGTRETRVDARVICATNRDPTDLVLQGALREDLYYRVSQVVLRVPALRERKGDIPRLARAFLQLAAAAEGKPFHDFQPEALRILADYHWPGNVRHLRNAVTESVVLHEGKTLTTEMLPPDIVQSVKDRLILPSPADPVAGPPRAVRPMWQLEKEAMQQALAACHGNVTAAAKMVEVSAATLYRKIKHYGLSLPA